MDATGRQGVRTGGGQGDGEAGHTWEEYGATRKTGARTGRWKGERHRSQRGNKAASVRIKTVLT